MFLKPLKTSIMIWGIRDIHGAAVLDQPSLKDHLDRSTIFILFLQNIHAEAVQSQFSYKTSQGNWRSYIKSCSERQGVKCILAAKPSLWIIWFHKSKSILMSLPLEMCSPHRKLSEDTFYRAIEPYDLCCISVITCTSPGQQMPFFC